MGAIFLIFKGDRWVGTDAFHRLDGSDLNATAQALLAEFAEGYDEPLRCSIFVVTDSRRVAFVGEEVRGVDE